MRGQAGPAHGHRRSVALWVAIENATLTPLDALGEKVQLLAVQRVKGVSDADRAGHFAGVSCS